MSTKATKTKTAFLSALAIVAALSFDGLAARFYGESASAPVARAQDNRRGGGRNWGGENGGQGGGERRGGGQRGGGRGGENRGGGQRGGRGFDFDSMTREQFDRIRNSPFADRVKERVGEDRWARWERGDFGSAADDAAKAQAQADGELQEITTELTEEEKADAEERLRSGTVPNFNEDGVPHYSIQTEADYYRQAMARRDDVLVESAPLALRRYARYVFNKYDQDGDGELSRQEWENRLEGAQAVDLNGDLVLSDQEVLYYLTRFAKDRTIFNPNPMRANDRRSNFIVEDAENDILIRPASAPPKVVSESDAREARRLNDGDANLEDMDEDELREMFTEGNPAMESVDDDEMLDALLVDMDESAVREFAAPPQVLKGAPVWFLARDVNGDGQLTLLEFAPNLSARLLALFGRYDADGDQVITAEEARKGPSAQQ
ncbi:MAG: hypothetical protein IJM30_07035 [Thermoguttaceae bacterium]|nr:hypothetical protein [Thermoguttaceae bacterium]